MTKTKKNRPAVAAAKRLDSHDKHENDCKVIISHAIEKSNTKLPVVGIYRDAAGRWPAMPILDMPEETPESWNAKAAAMRRKKGGGA